VSPVLTTPDVFAERPEASARFDAEVAERLVTRLRLICALGLVLVPGFFALDLLLHPQVARACLVIRSVMVVCLLGALALLRTDLGKRVIAPLSFLIVWQTGFGVALLTALDGGASSGYYAGLNLVMLAAASITRFRPA